MTLLALGQCQPPLADVMQAVPTPRD